MGVQWVISGIMVAKRWGGGGGGGGHVVIAI
jgi:hypothetical protein